MTLRFRAFALLAAGMLVAPAALHAQDKKDDKGFVQLFNGKDLDGWEAFDRAGKQDDFSKNWVVKDGVIHGMGPASHLFSPKGDYKNFIYRAEVKIADKANSGMYFRTAKGPGFPKGYEAQVNSTHTDPLRTGTLYSFVPVKKDLVPPDTWFTQEIEAVGDHIIIRVNGEKVVDFVDPKNTYKEGFFAFQQHDPGSKVQIRKVEVKELP
jgi:Domain of Unknown Function (DUF1080)